jgi:hypothetical protein
MVFLQGGESMHSLIARRSMMSLVVACVVGTAWVAAPAAAQGGQPQAQPHAYPQQPPAYDAQGTQQVIVVPDTAVPPPGAYTVQPVDRYQALQERLAYLRAERSRYSIGGSIVMMSIGGAMVILGASVGGVLRALDREGYAESTIFDRDRASIIFFTIMGGGAALMIGGSIKLARRAKMRRQYDPEIRQIREELRNMREPQYSYGAELDFGFTPAGLGARLRF